MTEKDLRKLIKKIENADSIDTLSDIAKLMLNTVLYDKNITIESKMRFLFLYIQHKNECISLQLTDTSNLSDNSNSIFKKVITKFKSTS